MAVDDSSDSARLTAAVDAIYLAAHQGDSARLAAAKKAVITAAGAWYSGVELR